MIVLLASCASLKTAFTGNQGTASTNNSTSVKKETKFLDQIEMPVESSKGVKEKEPAKKLTKRAYGPCTWIAGNTVPSLKEMLLG